MHPLLVSAIVVVLTSAPLVGGEVRARQDAEATPLSRQAGDAVRVWVARSAPGPTQPGSQRPPRRSGWIARHPALFGALVGFGAGCAWGVSQVGGSDDNFYNALDEFACPGVGGLGAGAGATIGWAISRMR